MYTRALLGLLLLVAYATASAQEHSIGGRAGLLGLGLEYSYRISERLAVRAAVHGSTYSFDAVKSSIDYELEFGYDSTSIGVDLHPRKNPLRLSVGLLSNDNSLDARSRPATSITIGDTTYPSGAVGTLRATTGYDDGIAPFVGIGWDWSYDKRVGFVLDMGVVRQGQPRVELSADGTLGDDPAFVADLGVEAAELAEALDGLDLYPFLSLGIVVRF